MANMQTAPWTEGTHATELHLGAELWWTRGMHATPQRINL